MPTSNRVCRKAPSMSSLIISCTSFQGRARHRTSRAAIVLIAPVVWLASGAAFAQEQLSSSEAAPIGYEDIVSGEATIADLRAAAARGIYPADLPDPRGEQSCLAFPQTAKTSLSRDDWRRALPQGTTLGYTSNCTECATTTDQGAIRLRMSPNARGSSKFDSGFNLEQPADGTFTLSQIVTFDPQMDWGGTNMSGKVGFGLGAGSRPSGGQTKKDGWTARLGWRSEADGTDPNKPPNMHLVFYIYNADRQQNYPYGDDVAFQHVLRPGVPMAVTMIVKPNSAPGVSDGWIKGLLDGELVARRDNIMWTGSGDVADTKVFQITSSTFHGGNGPSYAPSRTNFVEITGVCWAEDDAGARLIDLEKPLTPFQAVTTVPAGTDLPGPEAAREVVANAATGATATIAPTASPMGDDPGADETTAVPGAPSGFGGGTCAVDAPARALDEAVAAYATECPMHPRADCDPMPGGGWTCSSERIGMAAPPASPPADIAAARAWIEAGRPSGQDAFDVDAPTVQDMITQLADTMLGSTSTSAPATGASTAPPSEAAPFVPASGIPAGDLDAASVRRIGGGLTHQYSKRQAWSADDSLVELGESIVDADSGAVVIDRIPLTSARVWANTEPGVMYGMRGGSELVRWDVGTGEIESLRDFGTACSIGDGEGTISNDDRRLVLRCGDKLVSYDLPSRSVLGTAPVPGDYNWAGTSQSGEYILVERNVCCITPRALVRYASDFSGATTISTDVEHGDFGVTADGREAYVMTSGDDPFYVTLDDGVRHDVDLPVDGGLGFGHLSCRNIDRPGVCFFTAGNGGRIGAFRVAEGAQPIEEWGTHGSSEATYASQAKGSANRSGTSVIVISDRDGLGDYIISSSTAH